MSPDWQKSPSLFSKKTAENEAFDQAVLCSKDFSLYIHLIEFKFEKIAFLYWLTLHEVKISKWKTKIHSTTQIWRFKKKLSRNFKVFVEFIWVFNEIKWLNFSLFPPVHCPCVDRIVFFSFFASFLEDILLSWHFCGYEKGLPSVSFPNLLVSKAPPTLHSLLSSLPLAGPPIRPLDSRLDCVWGVVREFGLGQTEAAFLSFVVWSACAVWVQSRLLCWPASLGMARPHGLWRQVIPGNAT